MDYVDVEGDPNVPGHEECLILSRDGSHRLLFIEVAEMKAVKNRLYLDLEPIEGRREDERLGGPGRERVLHSEPRRRVCCVVGRRRAEIGVLTAFQLAVGVKVIQWVCRVSPVGPG